MKAAPEWALAVTYWLHMLATVAWLGGLSTLVLLILPAARRALDSEHQRDFLRQIRMRLQQIGWFSLLLLVATGMFQMSSNPNYHGFLAIENSWSAAILFKHLVIGLLILVSAYISWGLYPAVERAAIRVKAGDQQACAVIEKIEGRELNLLRVNLAISILVLALTAWARAA
jgi:uncharacterized membrane protein